MTVLAVGRPGLLTTVQDLGRWGWQALGVPVCGAMDTWSHRLANLLVGNGADRATLEITLGDFEAMLDVTRRVAITGARVDVIVDGARMPSPAVFTPPAAARITLTRASRGARAYVAVRGGFDVPLVLGSRSTDLRSGFGGLEGRALRRGGEVPLGPLPTGTGGLPVDGALVGPEGTVDHEVQLLAPEWLPGRGAETTLRVLPTDRTDEAPLVAHLVTGAWTVTPASDRMGYRLQGPAPDRALAGDVLTTPTAIGSIQVPPSGQPILLMADRQTTGGYAQPAAVIAADLPVAAQLAPGDRVRFVACSADAAHAALLAREASLLRIG